MSRTRRNIENAPNLEQYDNSDSEDDASHHFEVQALQEELLQSSKQISSFQRDIATLNVDLERERIAGIRLQDELRLGKEQISQLETLNQHLQSNVRDLQNYKARSVNRKTEEEYRAELKDKANQVSRYLSEINALSSQTCDLQEEVSSLTIELEATVNELDRCFLENKEMKIQIEEKNIEILFLIEEKDKLGTQLGERAKINRDEGILLNFM
jgi:chromosome segregation ATPase